MDSNTWYHVWDWTKKGAFVLAVGAIATNYFFCPGKVHVQDLNGDGKKDVFIDYMVGEDIFIDNGNNKFLHIDKFYNKKKNALEKEVEAEKRLVEEKAKEIK